jgi:hypothetical protein
MVIKPVDLGRTPTEHMHRGAMQFIIHHDQEHHCLEQCVMLGTMTIGSHFL